jgi:sensor c-di-GMP phosphodiesterase-like protein
VLRPSDTSPLAADLRRAIDGNEIELRYQPVVDMSNGGLRGVEALARWTHREREPSPPTSSSRSPSRTA